MMDDLQAVLDACLAGLGVAWLPRWLVLDHLGSGKLETLMLDHTAVEFPINAEWPRTPHLLLKTRVAVDALLQKTACSVGGYGSLSPRRTPVRYKKAHAHDLFKRVPVA
ncbi:LysR substrate-binding domain-containing protein [Pseudomonas sp. SMSB3]|uniref:LysR substrate-binding domain-containing protein n=1 Tax=Pseudomonas sp. SMSB3 TaxID=3390196 RepID=UPI003F83F26A